MSDSNDPRAGKAGRAPERFSTVMELQEVHDHLLEQSAGEAGGAVPAGFWADVERFVGRAASTGAWLDLRRERRLAQGILDYWAAALYRVDRGPAPARLADFDPELAPELPEEPCPYQGLAAFGAERQAFFHGREGLIRRTLERVGAGERFLAVVGDSGSGKSSFVLAGLAPRLALGEVTPPGGSRVITLVPGYRPLETLASTMAGAFGEDAASASPPARARVLSAEERFRRDPDALAGWVREHSPTPVVLVVDQFEEAFTLGGSDGEGREAFIRQLLGLASAPDRRDLVILTMRSEFEDSVARVPALHAAVKAGRVGVGALDVNELRAAIEQPAAQVGLRFDEGVVDDLVTTILGERAGLPLLQFALRRLWGRRERNRITARVYQEVGNPREALGRSADAFYRKLIPEDQSAVRGILLKLVRPDLGGGREFTSGRVLRSELFRGAVARPRVEEALRRLVAEGLLKETPGVGATDTQVEVAHEALVRNWELLAGWLEGEREALRKRRALRDRALAWKDGRASLLRDRELEDAADDPELAGVELEFVRASREEAEREQRAAEEAHVREIERQLRENERERVVEAEARRAREARRWSVILGFLTLAALGAMTYALLTRSEAERVSRTNKTLATSNANLASTLWTAFTNLARSDGSNRILASSNAAVAARLEQVNAVLSNTVSGLNEASNRLGQLNESLQSTNRLLTNAIAQAKRAALLAGEAEAKARRSEYERTTNLFASLLSSGVLLSRGGSFGAAAVALAESTHLDAAVARNPEGAGTRSRAGTRNLLAWFVRTRPQGALRSEHEESMPLRDIAVSPDRRWLVVGGERGQVALHDLVRGNRRDWLAHETTVRQLWFDPSGNWFASAGGGEDKRVIVWPVEEGRRPVTTHFSSAIRAMAGAGDGRWLAVASADDIVRIWCPTSTVAATEFKVNTPGVSCLAFAPEGLRMAAGTDRGRVILWEQKRGMIDWRDVPPPKTLIGFDGSIRQVAFHPGGALLATGCEDGTIQLWSATNGVLHRPLRGHRSRIDGLSFGTVAGRDVLISAGADRVLRIWDLATGAAGAVLEGHTAGVTGLAVAGDAVFSCSNDGSWREWVVSPEPPPLELTPGLEQPMSCALAPDATRVAVGGEDGGLRLLRLPEGEVVWRAAAHRGPLTRIAWHPRDNVLATAGADGRIRIWDGTTGESRGDVGLRPGRVEAVAFSADGRWLAAAADGRGAQIVPEASAIRTDQALSGEVSLWPWPLDRGPGRSVRAHRGAAHSVAFDENSRRIISAGADGQAVWWEVDTFPARPTRIGKPRGEELAWAAFRPLPPGINASNVSQVAMVGRGGVVRLVGATHQAEAGGGLVLAGHEDTIMRLEWGPGGAEALTASADGSIRCWDFEEGWEGFTLELPKSQGRDAPVRDLSFVPRTPAGEAWLAAPLSSGKVVVYRLGPIYPVTAPGRTH